MIGLGATHYGDMIISIIKKDILEKCSKGHSWEYNEYGEIEVDGCFYDLPSEIQSKVLILFRSHYYSLSKDLIEEFGMKDFNFEIEREDFFEEIIHYVMDAIDEADQYGENEDEDEHWFYSDSGLQESINL